MTGSPEYEFHEIASIFPLLEGAEFEKLLNDVRVHGVREPICVFEGKILDGRNRYNAAKATGGSLPPVREFSGTRLQALEFVWSLNFARRHLNPSQAAVADAERNKFHNAYAAVREAAQERQQAKLPSKGTQGFKKVHLGELIPPNKTRDTRAKVANTNPKYIDLADKLVAERPDIAEQVKQGKKTLTQVGREMKKEQVAAKVKELPEGKYRVIYADPPWSYNDTREGLGASEGQKVDRATTAAKNHYPTMTMAELAALDVKSLAADDAVLFMWATFPLLPEQLEVMKAWGFKYKTGFVWDKVRGSFGHYHTAEAELILIGTKGSCTPDAEKRERQIHQFPRSEHSRKPEEFRALIDRLYVHGPRIELFRRGVEPAGWHIWGAEIVEADAA